MARLGISVRAAPEPVAPAGIWFEATGLDAIAATPTAGTAHDPRFHDITFIWTIADAPLAPYSAPENMVEGWNNANRAYGQQVAFVFPDPGTYSIELTAIDRSGQVARASTTVTISDPDRVFAGPRTLCFSPDPAETWADVPTGALRIRSGQALREALLQTRAPARLLFRRGQRLSGVSLDIGRSQLAQIGSWGQGPRPVLISRTEATVFRYGRNSKPSQVTLSDLVFQGGWDSTTETGRHPDTPISWGAVRNRAHYTVWSCSFSGFDQIDVAVRDAASTMILGNSTVTNWRNYGFLMRSANARFGLVGMNIAQHPQARHGGPKEGGLANNHGPLRIPDCAQVYIGASNFFSRTGWSGLAGERADQPCIRLNTAGRRGMAAVIERVVAEGGNSVISITGANPNRQENPGNYLIDKALLIGTAKTTGPFIGVHMGGVTIRNVVGLLPNTPRKHPNRWPAAVRFGADKPGPGNTEAPVALYSSTFVSLLDRANSADLTWTLADGAEVFENHTIENNLIHAPSMGPAADPGDPLDLGQVLSGVAPQFLGSGYNFDPLRGQLAAAVPPGNAMILPFDALAAHPIASPDDRASGGPAQIPAAGIHMLRIGRQLYDAPSGHFALRATRSGIELTNRTEITWPAGATWTLRLDRRADLPPMDTRFASPETLPVPLPTRPGSGLGRAAYDDFFGQRRADPATPGAIEPR